MRYLLLVKWLDGAWHVAHQFESREEAEILRAKYINRFSVVHTRVFDTEANVMH